jgi:thiosulfate reductase cytochrome b subunit
MQAADSEVNLRDNPQSVAVLEIYRHPLPVRIFHWVNALCFVLLLMSGLQIFNAYPRLHWGNTGYFDTPAVFEITGNQDLEHPRGWVAINGRPVLVTRIFGAPHRDAGHISNNAFPWWLTLPWMDGGLALGFGRGWHFLALYLFTFNFLLYLLYGWVSRRFVDVLRPAPDQLRIRAVAQDLWMHLRLKHAHGAEALHYNLLQKLAYLVVLFVLMPLMILSGMTMSPSSLARAPWLLDLFHGRQTARTLHFIGAWSLVLFVMVHVFQVFVAGFANQMRSMVTGRFRVPREQT